MGSKANSKDGKEQKAKKEVGFAWYNKYNNMPNLKDRHGGITDGPTIKEYVKIRESIEGKLLEAEENEHKIDQLCSQIMERAKSKKSNRRFYSKMVKEILSTKESTVVPLRDAARREFEALGRRVKGDFRNYIIVNNGVFNPVSIQMLKDYSKTRFYDDALHYRGLQEVCPGGATGNWKALKNLFKADDSYKARKHRAKTPKYRANREKKKTAHKIRTTFPKKDYNEEKPVAVKDIAASYEPKKKLGWFGKTLIAAAVVAVIGAAAYVSTYLSKHNSFLQNNPAAVVEQIAETNSNITQHTNRIYIPQSSELPYQQSIERVVAISDVTQNLNKDYLERNDQQLSQQSELVERVVVTGDNVWDLSRKISGEGEDSFTRFKTAVDMNKYKTGDANMIFPGQVLYFIKNAEESKKE